MKLGTSFFLGVAVGILSVIVVDRARKMIREEDIDALKERISDGLRSLEGTVTGLTESVTGSFSEA